MTRKDLTLLSRIYEELSELERIVERIHKAWDSSLTTGDELYFDSVALNLHGFYSCLERIFELIAKNVDQSIPTGDSWHQELLKQMATDIRQIRPPVISRDTFLFLDEYRGFRHVVRNVYTFNLSEKKLRPLVCDFRKLHIQIKLEIVEFLKILEYNS
jgi:hypothetical protein